MDHNHLIGKLNDAGYEAYLVGGCVRDTLRGTVPQDYDIATSAPPKAVEEVFSGLRVVETGLKHGTVTVVLEGRPYEITTYRLDGAYSDGRHPDSVSFTGDLTEDLSRRDFTVNAMAMDKDGAVIDPFGGREDLKRGLIRAVGDPRRRFTEDALRILRALRFASVLDFEIDGGTAAAAHEMSSRLALVSAERCFAELCKLLCGPGARRVIEKHFEILCAVIPELQPMKGYDQMNHHHTHTLDVHSAIALENVPPVPYLRFAALFHDIGKPDCRSFDEAGEAHYYGHAAAGAEIAESILRRLRADKKTIEKVTFLVSHHDAPAEETKADVARKLRRYGEENYRDLIALRRADGLALAPGFSREEKHRACLRMIDGILAEKACFSLADLAVDGNDLIAAGVPEGPAVGCALNALLEAVLAGKADNDRAALLSYLELIR